MTKIEAKIIKHSRCPKGHELITYELVFPRFLLAELNTHRMFSKNSASSRAIPFKKMVEMVQNDPFIPIAWQTEHKGMQGTEYLTGDEAKIAELRWLQANVDAIHRAQMLNLAGVTKQLCNRLLEPFMWHKVLLTTGLEGLKNFFELRCPEYQLGENSYKSKKDWKKALESTLGLEESDDKTPLFWLKINKGQAEIHMMELAESMYDTYNESVPQNLKEGEWHIPYDDLLGLNSTSDNSPLEILSKKLSNTSMAYAEDMELLAIKASTGLCARTSYITVGDDKVPSIETLISIHDKMKDSVPFHASPYEHCSICPSQEEYDNSIRGSEKGWFRNYKGFKPYRQILEEKL